MLLLKITSTLRVRRIGDDIHAAARRLKVVQVHLKLLIHAPCHACLIAWQLIEKARLPSKDGGGKTQYYTEDRVGLYMRRTKLLMH